MNFNTIGIICEYNPFHFGHKYHIETTKKITGCKNIVCVMSGSMVQRGECAMYDKWSRAKAAIDAGADLVIELPAYYVLQSADIFASGAVQILDALKITDAISFGCECNNIDVLYKIADTMLSADNEYNLKLKTLVQSGLSYPKASEEALRELEPDLSHIIEKPNNTLGISYLKAIKNINSTMDAICIKRDNDYHSSDTNDEFMSASHIRDMILNGKDYSMYAPDLSGEEIYNLKNAEKFILGYLRCADKDKMKKIKGYEEGLENLVKSAAQKSTDIYELFSLCTNKRYTLHRIKRYIMSVLLNINYSFGRPCYIRVLAMNQNGISMLKEIKEKSELDIIVKAADYKKENQMFKTDIEATDFAALCSSHQQFNICGRDYTTSPYIKKVSR